MSRKGWKSGRMAMLFNWKDPLAKGRICMLYTSVSTYVITWLSAGVFYTSFLMIYDIDVVNIGILTFIPYIASCFGIFSPSILERFRKRKWVLAMGKLAYYTLNIFGITIMPVLVTDPQMRMSCFVVIVFTANTINALFSSGYSVWHVNFIPDNVRAEYFSMQNTIQGFIGCGAALLSGLVADALAGSAYEDTIIILLRYVAYGVGISDVIMSLQPKEFPYGQSEKPSLKHIITKPFSHPKFALTMMIVFLQAFGAAVPNASLNYYLLNDVGVNYTFIYIINMIYPVTLLLLLPTAKRILNRIGWFKTYAICLLLLAPTDLAYSFVTADNYLWLMPAVRIAQHVLGVAFNLTTLNMVYINLPKKDQTNYIAFHLLVTNLASFLGMMSGTGFVAWRGDEVVNLFGLAFTSTQNLLWVLSFFEVLVPVLVFLLMKKLLPSTEAED